MDSTLFFLLSVYLGNPPVWHYQLQSYTCPLSPLPHKVVDLDEYSCDMRGITLAYISIGEAEDYRKYWTSLPKDIIVEENPEWKGNYTVRFWDDRWKKVVFSRVQKAIDRGFSGVYLDKVDVYEEIGEAERMVVLICQISNFAKSKRPDFLVFVQNGLDLYPKIRNCIDGIGKEDTWFFDDEEIDANTSILRMAKRDDKIVMLVDYPTLPHNQIKFYRRCIGEGFLCTVSNRELNLPHPLYPLLWHPKQLKTLYTP